MFKNFSVLSFLKAFGVSLFLILSFFVFSNNVLAQTKPESSLLDLSQNPDPIPFLNAIQSIEKTSSSSPEVTEALTNILLQNSNSIIHHYSIKALRKINLEFPYQALIQALLEDSASRVRQNAASALGRLNIEAPEILSALIKTLEEDTDLEVRSQATRSLGEIRSNSSEVIRALTKALLEDPEPKVRYNACLSIRKIGSSHFGVPFALTTALLRDPDTKIRWEALRTLTEINSISPETFEDLIKALEELDSEDSSEFLKALKKALS